MLHRYSQLLLLLFITLIAASLRLYNLPQVPPSLNWDEVSHGYNAYSILKTGHDEWGVSFPLIFRTFGDYKLPLYIYLTTLPVALFGLTPFAVRFISVLAGILAIPGIYLLANKLLPQKMTLGKLTINSGHFAALFLTFLPWHFFVSRPALEANLSLTLFIFAAYFLLKGLENQKNWILSSLLFSLTLHTYNSYRVLTPLFLLLFFVFNFKKIKLSKTTWIAISIFMASSFLVAWQFLSGTGTARYSKLSILTDNTVFQIGEKRTQSSLPSPLPKLIYNRPVYFVSQVAKYYFGYFSPSFFYQSWGPQYQFAIPGSNLLTLPLYLLFIFGFLFSIKLIKNNSHLRFIFLWLLLSPIPASLTADPPQALRPTTMIPPLILISLFAFQQLPNLLKKTSPYLAAIFLLAFIFSFTLYLNRYLTFYKTTYSDSWQYGYQQAIEFINSQTTSTKIFFTKRYGEPHIFYTFYSKLDPKVIQPGGDNIRYPKSDWFWTDRINQTYFINDWQIPNKQVISSLPLESGANIEVKDALLVTSPDHLPSNTNIIKTINFLNGNPAFIIAKFN